MEIKIELKDLIKSPIPISTDSAKLQDRVSPRRHGLHRHSDIQAEQTSALQIHRFVNPMINKSNSLRQF